MPALVAFGRRWRIGSDDFVFPAIVEAFVRFSWVVLGTIMYALNAPLTCSSATENTELSAYLIGLLFINVSTTIACLAVAFVSSRGAIMDPRPRRLIPKLLYMRCPLFVLEIIWTIIATVEVFRGYDLCHFINYLRIIVVLAWAMILIVVVGLLVVFNPAKDNEFEDTRRNWRRNLSILKFRQDDLMRAAIDDIANLVASFFVDQNMVMSDVAAGMLLVVHSPNNDLPPIIEDKRPPLSWMTPSAALHFMHFATCVYGWPTYLMHNRSISAYSALAKNIKCCGKIRCDQVLIVEDNCCLCHTASFKLSLSGRNVDLFYMSFRNSLYQVPFVVLADHDSKSIVITIRGSCSFIDLVTDLSVDDEAFSIDVDADPILANDATLDTADGSEVRVHRGMLRSARYVFDTIKKHSVLEDMFVLNPSYGLVLCGHSLGAGVASLLTLLLKQQYPSVRCFAFSPPGCVISENGQAEMEQHVMSVIGGDDVVPRISYQSMHKLREAVEMELRTTTKAKYEVLIKGFFRLFVHAQWELTSTPAGAAMDSEAAERSATDELVLIRERTSSTGYGTASPPPVPRPSTAGGVVSIDMVHEERLQTNAHTTRTPTSQSPVSPVSASSLFTITTKAPERVTLYAPGRLLYVSLETDEEERERTLRLRRPWPNSKKDARVNSEWIDPKCLSDIKLTASAFTDHLPINVVDVLEKLVERDSRAAADAEVITVQPLATDSPTQQQRL